MLGRTSVVLELTLEVVVEERALLLGRARPKTYLHVFREVLHVSVLGSLIGRATIMRRGPPLEILLRPLYDLLDVDGPARRGCLACQRVQSRAVDTMVLDILHGWFSSTESCEGFPFI